MLRVSIACEIESERGAAIGNDKTDRDYSTVRDRAPGSTVEKRARRRGRPLSIKARKRSVVLLMHQFPERNVSAG